MMNRQIALQKISQINIEKFSQKIIVLLKKRMRILVLILLIEMNPRKLTMTADYKNIRIKLKIA